MGIPPWPKKGNGYLRKPMPVQWKVLEKRDERTVRIGNWVGWCPGGGPLPKIKGVRQVDHSNVVILTAILINRTHNCEADVVTPVEQVGRIRGGLQGRPLYDGS